MQRGQRRLHGLGCLGRGIPVDTHRAGDAVLRRELKELGEYLADLLLGHRPGEHRHRLSGDERDDHRDRLRAEGLRELRIGVDIDLRKDKTTAEFRHDALEHRAQLLAGSAPLGPQVDDDRHGARELEHLGERVVRDVHDQGRNGSGRHRLPVLPRRRRRRRTIAQGREVDSATQRGARGGIGHLITFELRMSDE
nr:hypothetical protein GCM10025699_29550 [Microbacterium flavescens]